MTTKKRKRIDPAKLPYGSNAQKFKDLLEIGFETMAYELPMSLEDYGGDKFISPADDGEIGFGLCQLSLKVHSVQCCEETRLVCFERGLFFSSGAILPFGNAPINAPEGYVFRDQTPESLAMMIFASIVSRNPCRPEGCGCESNHNMKMVEDYEEFKEEYLFYYK